MTDHSIQVSAIPAFEDNLFWAIHREGSAVVVDPGDAAPVEAWLAKSGCRLRGILLTHHHADHIGGAAQLSAAHKAWIVGHADDSHRLPPLSRAVRDGEHLWLEELQLALQVVATPGHTLGHICYVGEGLLFCGDTLFSGGCGRMFEGQPLPYHTALMRLAALPAETQLFAAHEYTLGNLRFAAELLPHDAGLQSALDEVTAKRAAGRNTLPSTIAWERMHNLFLRCDDPALATALGLAGAAPAQVFAALRRAKDQFRSR